MGFLNDLKKLIFGASSVAKHSSEKAGQFVKDEVEDLYDGTKQTIGKADESFSESTGALRDSIKKNADELKEKARSKMEEISESPAVRKAAETAEMIGEKILDGGENVVEKAKDLSEDVGEKVLDVKDEMLKKAREVADKAGEKLAETMDKAEKWAEEESKKPKREFAEEDLDISESMLSDKDDFFSKASKYADGDYAAFSEGQVNIEKIEQQKKQSTEKATGFEDLDGDGNEIIDDAIINESDNSTEEE